MGSLPRLLLVTMLCAPASGTMAALAISGTVSITPEPSALLRGDTATLKYVIANTGDEALTMAFGQTFYINVGPGSTIYPVANAATPPCEVTDDGFEPPPPPLPGIFINYTSFSPVPILPGESRECVLEFIVSEETAGPFVQSFSVWARNGSGIDSVNQSFYFGLGEDRAVPMLSLAGIGFLTFGLLTVAIIAGRSMRR